MKVTYPLLLLFLCFFGVLKIGISQDNHLDFDGINDYMEIPNNPAINFNTNDDFTVEAWLKIPSGGQLDLDVGDNDIIEKWSQTSEGYPFVVRYLNSNTGINKGKIHCARYDMTNNPAILSSVSLNDDNWHHIAFVKDGADLYLYIDGILDGTTTDNTTSSTQNNSSLFIGRRGCCGFDNFWRGGMDELRVWNDARSEAEITANMNIELNGSESNLVAYYNFNVGVCADDNTAIAAPEVIDLASVNHATLNNFAKIGCSSNFICDALPIATVEDLSTNLVSYWAFNGYANDEVGSNTGFIIGSGFSYPSAKFGKGIDLDGGDTYVDMGNDASLNFTGKSVTVSAWFRVDDFTEYWQALIAKGEAQNLRIHRFSLSNNLGYNGGSPDIFSPININDGEFHHVVAVTENGVSKSLYIDGFLTATSTNNPVITDTGLSLLIGNNPDVLSRDWNGVIDDVAIWDRALNDCEIATIYNSGMSIHDLLMLPAVPTLSQWGIIILSFLFLIIGLIIIKKRSFSLQLN